MGIFLRVFLQRAALSASILALCFLSASSSAEARSPRQNVSQSLDSLKSHTEQLVNQVQAYLQNAGRWSPSPQGKDMQLCQALQSFQKKVGKMKSDNSSKPYDTVHMDLQVLQFESQAVEQLLNQQTPSPLVAAAWMQLRNDLLSIGQALYPVQGFNPGNFYDMESGVVPNTAFPETGFQPGAGSFQPSPFANQASQTAHFGPAVFSSLNGAEDQTERFVKQLTAYLQTKGQWPPAQGSPEMSLCQNLQSFQEQLRKFRTSLQSNMAYSLLRTQLNQLGSISQNIDQLLLQISARPEITSRWNEVRTNMNSAYQAFYSAGSSGYMWMR